MNAALLKLLSLLADGEFHSGEELGATIGVSRTAVWKTLKGLSDYGIDLHCVTRRGYQIPNGFTLLSTEKILSTLSPNARALLAELVLLPTIDSTNQYILERVSQGLPSGYTVFAEQQTQGRGRLGRPWISPFGRNLYVSLLWQVPGSAAMLAGLSLVIGIAVVRAIERLGVKGLGLKWPNDIVANQQKCAGVLLEITGDAAGPCSVVIGVGLNIDMPKNPAIDQPWIDLASLTDSKPDRNMVAGTVLDELLQAVVQFETQGFDDFQTAWQRYDVLAEQPITVHTSQGEVRGIAKGVDAQGNLCCEVKGEIAVFSSAQVSLNKPLKNHMT